MTSWMGSYGGFLSVGLAAGETAVVNGATGSFGSAAVAVALAMGAARVVATGRTEAALNTLAERYGHRVRAARMVGNQDTDTAAIQAAAGRPIDVVLDILPPQATVSQVLGAIRAVRAGGRVSLMGGVGMTGGGDLTLPYAWLMRNNIAIRGQWMYPRAAIGPLIALVQNGVIDLQHYEVTEVPLASIADAITHAAQNAGPWKRTVLRF